MTNKEFVQKGINGNFIDQARRQQDQLAYFLVSDIENNLITPQYIEQWANRKYETNDYFLNYIKSIFKTGIFINFLKYLRKPIPSAKLIKIEIEPQLRRVFISEDGEERYNVVGVDYAQIKKDLDCKNFEQELFDRFLYKHNSIVVADVKDGKAYRYFVDIKNVRSVEEYENEITRVSFSGYVEDQKGFIYIDDKVYEFYDTDFKLINSVPHKLGYCPARFVCNKPFGGKKVIKESFFSYFREELEEYVFLKTILKMIEPNGGIATITKLKTEEEASENGGGGQEPEIQDKMSSQYPDEFAGTPPVPNGDFQPGTILEIDPILKNDGSVDMDAVRDLINFHYIPPENLNYIKERIQDIKKSILNSILGVIDETGEGSKNEMHIEKAMNVLQTTLIQISDGMSYIRQKSDYDILALNYGVKRIKEVFVFYGKDHYIDSQTKLFNDLTKAPNPIETKNILLRINKNKYKGNKFQLLRQEILYELIPFITDDYFEKVKEYIDQETFIYYVRFPYWIAQFEKKYGDIVSFYMNEPGEKEEKMDFINRLIIEIINENNLHFNKEGGFARPNNTGDTVRGIREQV